MLLDHFEFVCDFAGQQTVQKTQITVTESHSVLEISVVDLGGIHIKI